MLTIQDYIIILTIGVVGFIFIDNLELLSYLKQNKKGVYKNKRIYLPEEIWVDIYKRLLKWEKQTVIAKEFGIWQSTISTRYNKFLNKIIWKNVNTVFEK